LAVSHQPDTDAGTGLFSSMSRKKMALLVLVIIIGGFVQVRPRCYSYRKIL